MRAIPGHAQCMSKEQKKKRKEKRRRRRKKIKKSMIVGRRQKTQSWSGVEELFHRSPDS